jgi:hypothetical protein
MNDSSSPEDEPSPPIQPPCSRAEAIGTGIWAILFSHLIVCLLAVGFFATRYEAGGVWLGLGIAAGLAAAIPFVVLPVGAAIGLLAHVLFDGTRHSVEGITCLAAIFFEANVIGWVIMVTIWLDQ